MSAPFLLVHVDGMPQTKGSWKAVRRRGMTKLIPDNDLEVEWAARVAWMVKIAPSMRGRKPDPDARFSVKLDFWLLPKVGKKNRRDVDKLSRSCLDAMTGLVYADDEQVDELVARKFVVEPKYRIGVDIYVSLL